MAITRIQNVYRLTTDMDRDGAFYDSIGLPTKFRDGNRWMQFGVGGSNLSLAASDELPGDAQGLILVLQSDDPSDHALIVAAGATFQGRRDMGSHGSVGTYRDPAGQMFQIFWAMPAQDQSAPPGAAEVNSHTAGSETSSR